METLSSSRATGYGMNIAFRGEAQHQGSEVGAEEGKDLAQIRLAVVHCVVRS